MNFNVLPFNNTGSIFSKTLEKEKIDERIVGGRRLAEQRRYKAICRRNFLKLIVEKE